MRCVIVKSMNNDIMKIKMLIVMKLMMLTKFVFKTAANNDV